MDKKIFSIKQEENYLPESPFNINQWIKIGNKKNKIFEDRLDIHLVNGYLNRYRIELTEELREKIEYLEYLAELLRQEKQYNREYSRIVKMGEQIIPTILCMDDETLAHKIADGELLYYGDINPYRDIDEILINFIILSGDISIQIEKLKINRQSYLSYAKTVALLFCHDILFYLSDLTNTRFDLSFYLLSGHKDKKTDPMSFYIYMNFLEELYLDLNSPFLLAGSLSEGTGRPRNNDEDKKYCLFPDFFIKSNIFDFNHFSDEKSIIDLNYQLTKILTSKFAYNRIYWLFFMPERMIIDQEISGNYNSGAIGKKAIKGIKQDLWFPNENNYLLEMNDYFPKLYAAETSGWSLMNKKWTDKRRDRKKTYQYETHLRLWFLEKMVDDAISFRMQKLGWA